MVLEARQARAGDDGALAHRADRTILVVADDPDACEVLVRLLVHAGFRADGASEVAEAMSVLVQADADAVVLHTTEARSGAVPLEVLRTLRESRAPTAAVPVVAVVAEAEQATAAQEGGADRVLRQPVPVDDLAAELDAATRP